MRKQQDSNIDILTKELEQLRKEVAELKAQGNTQDTGNGNTWLSYGEFTRRNGMGRSRLERLITVGKIAVDKSLGNRAYLYKWA